MTACRQFRRRDRKVIPLADALDEMRLVEGHLLFKCCDCNVEPFATVAAWAQHIREWHADNHNLTVVMVDPA